MSHFRSPSSKPPPPAPMDAPVEPIADSVLNDWVVLIAQIGLLAAFVLVAIDAWPLKLPSLIGLGIALCILVASRVGLGNSFRVLASPNGKGLKRSGIYGFVRNPMYLGLLLAAGAVCLSSRSLSWILFAFLLTVLLAKVRAEENYLKDTYPEYLDYAKRTKCLIPWVW